MYIFAERLSFLSKLKNVTEHQPPIQGFLNIPFIMDWTLLLYFAIVYFKCQIAFHGVKPNLLPFPLSNFAKTFRRFFKTTFPLPLPESSIPLIDEESLFYKAFNVEVQSCVVLLTAVGVVSKELAFMIDMVFLGTLAWHFLYLYRRNIARYVCLLLSLYILWFVLNVVFATSINYWDLLFLSIALVAGLLLLPEKINFDIILLYSLIIGYVIGKLYVNISAIGIQCVNGKLLEYRGLTWLLEFFNETRVNKPEIQKISGVSSR